MTGRPRRSPDASPFVNAPLDLVRDTGAAERLDDPLVYPNGLSTSLPVDVQEAMIRNEMKHNHVRHDALDAAAGAMRCTPSLVVKVASDSSP